MKNFGILGANKRDIVSLGQLTAGWPVKWTALRKSTRRDQIRSLTAIFYFWNAKDGSSIVKELRGYTESGGTVLCFAHNIPTSELETIYQLGIQKCFDWSRLQTTRFNELIQWFKSYFESPDTSLFSKIYMTRDEKLQNQILHAIHLFKRGDQPILMHGPTGVGKTKLAKVLHKMACPGKPFIHVNLSELSESTIESELFGHTKGAFTGAYQDKEGLLSLADGGTLFLDEVGTIPVLLQKKLLKTLDEKNVTKVGATKSEPCNFRLISATCDDLKELIEKKKFRLDFYFRLRGFDLKLPALKERPSDILALIENLMEEKALKLCFDDQVKSQFVQYSWPGNIREMKHLLSDLSQLSCGYISLDKLPLSFLSENMFSSHDQSVQPFVTPSMQSIVNEHGLPYLLRQIERDIIRETLLNKNGRINQVTRKLKISKSLLYRVQKEIKNLESSQQLS